MKFTSNKKSVAYLEYYLILSTQFRKEVITEDISIRLKELFERYGETYHLTLKKWEYTNNYVKIWFDAEPNSEISKFINAFKSASSRNIKKEFPDIVPLLPNGQFWSKAYCIFSIGEVDESVVEEYLERQQSDKIDRRFKENRKK